MIQLKKPTYENMKVSNKPETKDMINRELTGIHRKMIELFSVNFTYFSDIKIIPHAEVIKQLSQCILNNLKENDIYGDYHRKQIHESLSNNQVPGFFENLAFYNPKDEILYINEKMILNHPKKIITICVHELSEKLLSTYLSQPLKTSIQTLLKGYIEAKIMNNTRKLYKLMDTYLDIVFKNVFKEGVCEAIAFQTLHQIDSEIKVAPLEEELQIGHSKCIGLLLDLENAKKNVTPFRKNQNLLDKNKWRIQREIDAEKLVKETLRSSQIIKGLSYYLGYPLAKAVLEKYGIKGVKIALEKYPPLKAQNFANPQTYLTRLEKLITFNK